MGDKVNSRWRPPPSWIYYCCQFLAIPLVFCSSWLHSCKISII